MEELQKQLAEERRQEELQRLEEESGRVDASKAMRQRRIGWMYEHAGVAEEGSGKEGEGKEGDEKEREDIMLGRQAVDVEKVGERQREERAALVDMEAKMREDPLLQIQLQASRAGLVPVAPAAPAARSRGESASRAREVASRKAQERDGRREERRRIREERQVRRANRAIRKQRHAQREETSRRPEAGRTRAGTRSRITRRD